MSDLQLKRKKFISQLRLTDVEFQCHTYEKTKWIALTMYIIDPSNPPVRVIDLFSHTTYIVCVNFIHKWRDLQFKINSDWQIFWETFSSQFYLLSVFLPEICWEDIAEQILFVFCFDVLPGARTLDLSLISQYTTYYTMATLIKLLWFKLISYRWHTELCKQ